MKDADAPARFPSRELRLAGFRYRLHS